MVTNREHYSWSQQSLFLSSKLAFYKKYVLGEDGRSNIRFDKGKEFADFKETGLIPHWVDDPLLETVAEAVPSYDRQEEKLMIDMFAGVDDKPPYAKPILMFTDSSNDDSTHILEYKTGKVAWTQELVDDHEQLDFYAMGYFIRSGQTTIPKFTLYWIETEDIELPNGDISVRYTGHVEAFDREFTEKDILRIMMKTLATMKEIYEYEYEELELEDTFVDRYVELLDQQEKISSELGLMKLEVESMMMGDGVKYAVGKNGKFSVSQRKTWKYPKAIADVKEKYSKEVKALEKTAQKEKTATQYVSESVRFTKSK